MSPIKRCLTTIQDQPTCHIIRKTLVSHKSLASVPINRTDTNYMNLFCDSNSVGGSGGGSSHSEDLLSNRSLSPNSTDVLIADALKNLALQDRERVYHEIHGVADAIDEQPEFVANCLHEMQGQLEKLKLETSSQSKATQPAELGEEEFVNNQEFRLGFLRSENFHAGRAAARMMRFFDWKRQLFGESKLCQEITLEDLEPEDTTLLRKGYFQVLPERDRAGRRVDVLFVQEANREYAASPESLVRTSTQSTKHRTEQTTYCNNSRCFTHTLSI
jgi:hypothetical protein